MTTITRPRDLVFTFSFETWNDAVQRGMFRPPDRLLTTVLADDRVRKVLVANPFRSAPVRLLKDLVGQSDAPFPTTADHRLLTPLRARRNDPADVPALRDVYLRYDARLKAGAQRLEMQDPAVISANPFVVGFCPFDWASPIAFYARDDWATHPSKKYWWQAIRAAYRQIQQVGRPVLAVSQQILDRIEPSGPTAVVPNGVDPQEWIGPKPEEPEWLSAIPHPRALYAGSLDSRLDVQGLTALARARPDLHIVLVGPATEPLVLQSIRGVANIHIHGHVNRAQLVAAVRNSDFCLVSHLRTQLTEAMSPLKIYEYLAGGCPVLATDLAPCRNISDRVVLTQTVSEFVDVVDHVLDLGPAPEEERLRFIENNSWARCHDFILSTVLGVPSSVA